MPIPEVEIPLALDSNLKTAEFIANIRANAFAAMSSPDDDEKVAQELSSLSESDSELESEPLNFFCLAKSKGPVTKTSQVSMSTDFTALGQIFSSPLTDIDEVDRRTRHSKRNLPSPTPSSSRTRRVPNKRPSILTIPPPPRKKRPTDPFSKLLKEKAEEEKFAPLRKSLLDFTLDLTDEDDEDENSASVSKRKRRLGSLHTSDEGDIDNVVDETARTRLLGMDDDGKLGRIIDDDRAENGKGKEKGSILGVPFFKTASDADMEIDRSEFVFPSLEGISEDPLMDLLKSCVDAKDTNGAAVVLGCSVFSMPSFSLSCGFLSWLFEVSLFSQGHLARSSSNLLHHICETHPSAKETFVSVSPILKALVWLGARKDVLDTIGFDDLPCNTHGNAPYQSEVLWRLSRLINLFGKNKMLDPTVVPSCVSLMIAIGMDVQTDFDLKLSITAAINTLIIGYCSRFTMERGEMELSICSRILPLTANLSPANREYLLTFINGVSRTARRIAQWIGFAMLTDDFGAQLASEYVDGPPALSYVIALLNPGSTDESQPGLFDLRRSAEQGDDFDYVALGHHIEVLAHVLMNIAEYVQLEQLEGGPTPAGSFSGVTSDNDSPSKSKSTSEKSKLEAIRMLLERLGNKIVDTRAAHLDRSQTKASILRLTMRMRYQCLASRGKSEKGKDGKLETFWPKA
ncbi:hypothetical protein EW145_g5543 [Phellinidium pouzarii]|uniref:Uncharacterized protein n=1 Tax=Phellinidium pouzarii TaxID=167371 RepID=A0A4S4KZL9_9AGAM|nr:hypothetical protein EW145_g5543 [Phellinidium pouzarii]